MSPACPDGSRPQQETDLAAAALAWTPGFVAGLPAHGCGTDLFGSFAAD